MCAASFPSNRISATAWDVNVGLSPGLSSFFRTPSLVFDSPTTPPLVSGAVELSGLASGGLSAELDLFVPVNTLVGYSGGSLIDISAGSPPISQLVAPGDEGSYGTLTSGTLSSAVVSPEPATFTLLATAFLACGAYGLFRRRRGRRKRRSSADEQLPRRATLRTTLEDRPSTGTRIRPRKTKRPGTCWHAPGRDFCMIADERGRTFTPKRGNRTLNPARLPIPPRPRER